MMPRRVSTKYNIACFISDSRHRIILPSADAICSRSPFGSDEISRAVVVVLVRDKWEHNTQQHVYTYSPTQL